MWARYGAIGLLAIGVWGCGPPSVTPVLPPGVQLAPPRPASDEEGAAEALGEERAAAGVLASELQTRVAEPTPVGQPKTTKSGLTYETLTAGDGPQARPSGIVTIRYTGMLKDGKVFDRSDALTFHVGAGEVTVKGLDEGVTGMLVGEKRKLIVPAKLGYGDEPRVRFVPPKATLIYEVELTDLK